MKKILFVFFVLMWSIALAQNYNIKQYTVRDGLLHSFVNDLIQDERGNVWIATGGGLCMFNGVTFTNYTTKNGLNYSRLLCLVEDANSNIWIGSSKGLNVYNGSLIYSLQSDSLGDYVVALEKSKNGEMWVATNKGVSSVQLKNNKLIFKKLPYNFGDESKSNLPFQDRVLSNFLLMTKEQKLIIGLNNSLFIYQENKLEKIQLPVEVEVYSACELFNGEVVFGTNKGLYRYKNNNFEKIENVNIEGIEVVKIKRTEDKLWMLGKWKEKTGNELFLVSISLSDNKYFRKIGKINGLINSPTSLFIDHEKNIWTGSNGGLSILRGETFINFTKEHGLIGNKIWEIYQDNDSKIWIGTLGDGLSIYNNGVFLNYSLAEGLPDTYISRVFQNGTNKFLFGTIKKGICEAIYNTKSGSYKFKQIPFTSTSEEIRIDDIERDKNGLLLVASSKGLFYSENNTAFFHQPLFAEDSNQVMAQKILITRKGNVWVATRNHGVFIRHENGFQKIFGNSLDKLGIISICEDSYGNVWAGSHIYGLYMLSGKHLLHFTDKEGLSSNILYILQPDRNGNLWIGSNLGLDKLNGSEFKNTGKFLIRQYDTDDGLQDLEMNMNGSIEDINGNLWFATNNGVLKYDYKYDINNSIPPITNLLNLKLHSKTVDWSTYSDSILQWNLLPVKPVLPYSENHLTFEFVGISFKNPKKIMYSWILEGFDQNWVPPTNNRQAIYSNLPPGEYIFKLKSANNNGVWNTKTIEFSFEISPPIWKTTWFILLMIVVFISLIFAFIKWRERSLKREKQILEQKIKDRTIQLSAANLELNNQKQEIQEKNEELNQQNEEISTQRDEITAQRDIVTKQKDYIEHILEEQTDSIRYAERIQQAVLPREEFIREKISGEFFILFKPRDIVSGDFYFIEKRKQMLLIAVADCTGHGVPGAFLSMLGISFLNEIISKEEVQSASKVLEELRQYVIHSLQQKGISGEQQDGMDISFIAINTETLTLEFAGANNPLYIIPTDKNEIITIKADSMPVGIYGDMKPFVNNTVKINKGDRLYVFTDGFIDQFGGEDHKKFLLKRFKKTLLQIVHLPMQKQKENLNNIFEIWKGKNEQIDDVTVMGIRI